tara:strand:+ start:926 stop:1723 length:798 start_codon:yes stop_codon:yes gene_type:complete
MKLPVVKTPYGIIIYDGPSLFDGKPIVAIATGFSKNNSKNPKTGEMIQTWIIRKDMMPFEANQEGEDESVCGDCRHRLLGTCYVTMYYGPHNIYRHYKRGVYAPAKPGMISLFAGRHVRFGSYGDPCAIPLQIWDSIADVAKGWTGYTHAWKQSRFSSWKKYCMASSDNIGEAQHAMKRGWKPFYVRSEDEPLPDTFFECPASEAAGKRLTCDQCLVCKGGEYRKGQGVPSIQSHGTGYKIKRIRQVAELERKKKAWRRLDWVAG